MVTTTERDWVEAVGKPAFAAIREMVKALQCDWDRLEELREYPDEPDELADLEAAAGDCKDFDEAGDRILEDPLEIELGGWWAPGCEPEATEYRILLTTGGPAVRIVGNLDRGDAQSARLEVQDWFKPWTEYYSGDSDHDEILMAYVECHHLDSDW